MAGVHYGFRHIKQESYWRDVNPTKDRVQRFAKIIFVDSNRAANRE